MVLGVVGRAAKVHEPLQLFLASVQAAISSWDPACRETLARKALEARTAATVMDISAGQGDMFKAAAIMSVGMDEVMRQLGGSMPNMHGICTRLDDAKSCVLREFRQAQAQAQAQAEAARASRARATPQVWTCYDGLAGGAMRCSQAGPARHPQCGG
jgi:hypothetical protein